MFFQLKTLVNRLTYITISNPMLTAVLDPDGGCNDHVRNVSDYKR